MRSAQIDRVFVIWIAALLVLWTACLVILWGWAFDTSGASALITLAATMLAISAAVVFPPRAAQAARRVVVWLRLEDLPATAFSQAGTGRIGPRQARALTRMLAVATIFAVACGFCSMLAIYVGRSFADAVGRRFLWMPLAWGALKLLVQFVGMFPIAMGLTATFLSTSLLRSGSGRDVYASLCGDWLRAIAAGLLIFSIVWLGGVNLVGAACVAGLLLLACAVGLFSRQRVTVRPVRRVGAAQPAPARRSELKVLAGFAALALSLLVQLRLLADVGGLGLPVRVGWLALSLGALGTFVRRADRRSRPPGRRQDAGAVIGIMAGLMIQSALAGTCVSAQSQGNGLLTALCTCFAVGLQIPIAALAGIVFSRQRRLFAIGGGGAPAYAGAATMGCGLGVLAYLAALSLPAGATMLLAGGLAVLAGGVIAGIGGAVRPDRQLRWGGWGAALICAVAASMLVARRQAGPAGSTVTAGTWLTSVVVPQEGSRVPRRAGCLPILHRWRSDALSYAMAQIMIAQERRASGQNLRWWVVSSSDLDLPGAALAEVFMSSSFPDPAAVPPGRWRDLLVPGADAGFLQAAQTSNQRFDGIMLAPLPADHPHAWRCYNTQALRRCWSRTHPNGLFLLRTQARPGYFAAALSVARTFHSVVGPGWAVAEIRGGRLDLLLVGPAGAAAARPSTSPEGVFVVSTERIWEDWSQIALISLASPTALRYSRRPSAISLQYWLDSVQEPRP